MPPPKDPSKIEEYRKHMSDVIKKKHAEDPDWHNLNKAAIKKAMSEPGLRKRLSILKKGKSLPFSQREKMSQVRKGKKQSIGTITKRWKNYHGEKCYLWRGGIAYLPYCFKFNRKRKTATRTFFGNSCICCGAHVTELRVNLHVHHVDHDKDQGCNGKSFNLVPLCQSDHAKELFDDTYQSYINNALEEGFKWGIWSREQYELEVMYAE